MSSRIGIVVPIKYRFIFEVGESVSLKEEHGGCPK